MGYDLHITRADDWCENRGHEIPLEQWISLVESDPELRFDSNGEPGFAVWSGTSDLEFPWLAWSAGNIHTKYPDTLLSNEGVSSDPGRWARQLIARPLGG